MRRFVRIAWSFGVVAMLTAVQNESLFAGAKLDPAVVKALSNNESFPIMVVMKAEADLSEAPNLNPRETRIRFVYETLSKTASTSQAELRAWLGEKNIKHKAYFLSNTVAVFNASAAQIKEISQRNDVARIVGNAATAGLNPVDFDSPVNSLLSPAEVGPNISSVKADQVWNELNIRGQGIVVASQDTGVEWTHPALKAKYRGVNSDGTVDHSFSWHDAIDEAIGGSNNRCGFSLKEPCDDGDHGTHTVGTMVGDDGAENKIGMAPGAQWIACRNMNGGVGRANTYLECFEYFLAPYKSDADKWTQGRPDLAPHVVNNSWGCPDTEGCVGDELASALKALTAAGIAVVVSAGNDGPDCDTIKWAPAFHTADTISVGAHDHRNGKIAYFSSRGPSTFDRQVGPDITAPGVSVRSSVPGGAYDGFMWSGTSMAGPHVAGLVALMWSANAKVIGNTKLTEDILKRTALPKTTTQSCGGVAGSVVPNNTYGYGAIQAYEAVKASMAIAD